MESEIQKRRGGMSHIGMTHGRHMTHGNSNSGESARTCVHCELPENLVRCQHFSKYCWHSGKNVDKNFVDIEKVFTYTIDASERQPLLPKIVCDAHL